MEEGEDWIRWLRDEMGMVKQWEEASEDDHTKKGEDYRQAGQEEVNKGRNVAAGRVRQTDKHEWTAEKERWRIRGR